MTASQNPRDELPRLLSALEDGTLEPEDEARLAELLRTDPAARTKYYEHVMLSALLRREGRREAAQSKDDAGTLRVQVPGSSTQIVPTTYRRVWQGALAASILLVLALSVGEATGVTQFVPTIIRVVTGEGSLVIEVDDPSVSVTLDGQDVTITGAGIHELRIRPGTHKVVTTKDGQPLAEEIVTVDRGGRQMVKISRPPAAAASAAADHAAVPGLRLLKGHAGRIWSMAFAGPLLLTAGEDHWVRVWDVVTGEEVQRFDGHAQTVYALAITPDGRRAISGSGGQLLGQAENVEWSVCLWEIDSGRELHRLKGTGPGITSIALAADGKSALLAGFDGTVRVWDVAQWREIRQFKVPRGLWSIRFSADDMQALTAGGLNNESHVALWNLETGEQVRSFVGHKFGAWRAVFFPDGSIFSSGQDATARRWQSETGEQLQLLRHDGQVTGLAASACGQFLLAGTFSDGNERNLLLWDLTHPDHPRALPGLADSVIAVALSPDGTWAAAAGTSGRVGLWALPPPAPAQPAAVGAPRAAPD